MRVIHDIHPGPAFKNAVITVGTFDGVHLGHREILKKLKTLAKDISGETVIITFSPHPRNIINPDHPVSILTTMEEKLHLLQELHIDNVVIIPFSREFSEMEATDYVNHFLIGLFHPSVIVFGYDHKFGKNRQGDIGLLRKLAGESHIRIEEIPAHVIRDIAVSSTKIRAYLSEGDVKKAAELLGYNYMLSGLVVKGDQLGRELGYPTANLHMDSEEKLIPADGIYAVEVKLKEEHYFGLMHIGMRPTFNGDERRLEVFILDMDKNIYGEKLTVGFIERIRGVEKFDSREALIKAMDRDTEAALRIFKL